MGVSVGVSVHVGVSVGVSVGVGACGCMWVHVCASMHDARRKIRLDLAGSGGIWWDLVGSGGIWWDLAGSGGIWWDLDEQLRRPCVVRWCGWSWS